MKLSIFFHDVKTNSCFVGSKVILNVAANAYAEAFFCNTIWTIPFNVGVEFKFLKYLNFLSWLKGLILITNQLIIKLLHFHVKLHLGSPTLCDEISDIFFCKISNGKINFLTIKETLWHDYDTHSQLNESTWIEFFDDQRVQCQHKLPLRFHLTWQANTKKLYTLNCIKLTFIDNNKH